MLWEIKKRRTRRRPTSAKKTLPRSKRHEEKPKRSERKSIAKWRKIEKRCDRKYEIRFVWTSSICLSVHIVRVH